MNILKRALSVLMVVIAVISISNFSAGAESLGTKAKTVNNEIIPGDINNDSKINSKDALSVLKVAIGLDEITDKILAAGDIDLNGVLNSADALFILQKAIQEEIIVNKIEIDTKNKTVAIGTTVTVKVKTIIPIIADDKSIKWTSSNTGVATVDKSGNVKAVAAGSATITASSVKNLNAKASFVLTVGAKASSVTLGSSSLSLKQGKSFAVQATVYPKNTYNKGLIWTSSNTSVATVNDKGVIWPKVMGTATITCTTKDGTKKTASCTIKVSAMNIPYVSQLPKYPTGCEAASCCMLLKYYGYSITMDQMIQIIPRKNIYTKNGKRYGPDINEMFVGDPRFYYTSSTPGYGVFSPAVTKALQKAIDQRGGGFKAVKISGCKFSDLLSKVTAGHPAIVWATYKMQKPTSVNSWYIESTGKYFEYPRGTHVMILSGYSADKVVTVDPYDNGVLTFSRSTFEDRWNLLGKQAIILEKS